MIFYLCDKKNPNCEGNCDLSECRHTANVSHAINGPCTDPEKHPERFDRHVLTAGEFYIFQYWEKAPESQK